MNYRPYERYKDSGVEWLGEVPEGWGIKRLKYVASINDEALSETTNPEYEFSYVDISSRPGFRESSSRFFETDPEPVSLYPNEHGLKIRLACRRFQVESPL